MLMSRVTFVLVIQICWCQELHLVWSYKYADVKNYIWSGHTNVLMSRITFGLVMQICWCQGQTGPRRPQSLWIKRPSWLLTVTLVHKYKKVNKIYTLCHGYNFIRSFASNSEMADSGVCFEMKSQIISKGFSSTS